MGVQYSLSSGCLLDPFTKKVLISTYERQLQLAHRSSIPNIEIWPIRGLPALELLSYELVPALVNHDLLQAVSSFHQSPREQEFYRFFLSASDAKVIAALPKRDNSEHNLARMHHVFGEKPTVLYASGDKSKLSRIVMQFPRRVLQFDPDTAHAWNVTDVIAFTDVAEDLGVNEFCIDDTHFRRISYKGIPSPFCEWEQPLRRLMRQKGKQVTIFHLAIGRKDMLSYMPSTMQELIDVMVGNMNSEIIHFMQILHEEGFDGLIVFEILPEAIWDVYETAYGTRPRIFSDELLVRAFTDVRYTCEKVFNQ